MSVLRRLVSAVLLLLLASGCGPRLPSLGLPKPTVSNLTPIAAASPTAQAPDVPQSFRVQAVAHSKSDALQDVALAIRRVTLSHNALVIRMAYENLSDRSFFITGSIPRDSIVLANAGGQRYLPDRMESGLSTIEPDGGFAPGGANVGDLVFPRPADRPPFELRVPNFEPLRFELDTPLVNGPPAIPPNGTWSVGLTLHSGDKALSPIELRVLSVKLLTDTLTLNLAFVNTYRQGYRLFNGPAGGDARLLDNEGKQAHPSTVSESLQGSIAPKDGWDAGGENVGDLTFARPAALDRVRLVFPAYSAAELEFDPSGLAEARVTSPGGGEPAPTATPEAGERVYQEISHTLARQSNALLTGDGSAYLATFTLDQATGQQAIFKRAASMPFDSYSVELDPNSELPSGKDRLADVRVLVRYTLRGVQSNSFLHLARYSFVQQKGQWLVSGVKPEEDPPFWWTGEVVAQTSPHFLIFTRPQVSKQLPGLASKAEEGYTALAAEGLTLEPRYVAFFTSDQRDFSQFASRAALLAGVALWRFEFQRDAIVVHSRAFFINGDIFARDQARGNDLQVTITHELVHLVLSPSTRPFTPAWLAEGAAVYFSHQNTPDDLRRLLQDGRLNNLHLDALTRANELGEHDAIGDQMADEYVYSGAVVSYLVDRFGQDTVLDFYRSYADVPAARVRDKVPTYIPSSEAGSVFQDLRVEFTQAAVERYFGLSLDALDGTVQAWLKK